MLKHSIKNTEEIEKRIPHLEDKLRDLIHPEDEPLLFMNLMEGLTFGGGFRKI